MPELRKDPVTRTWVIISEERKLRPQYYRAEVNRDLSGPKDCPFCPGNEEMTPPEIFALRPPGQAANRPGWQLRVIPNKFPALRVEGELGRTGEGLYDRMNGIGAHEVIIESPEHGADLADLPAPEIARVLSALRGRILDLKKDIRFRYIMAFKNSGPAAGATLAHSHTQLIALPVVPERVQAEIEGAQSHFRQKERCIFCDIIRQERADQRRVLLENDGFIVLAPYAPRFPFELSFFPRRHAVRFEHETDEALLVLAEVLKECLARVRRALARPDYNFLLHSAPFGQEIDDHFHWHIEFMPVLSRVAGFEWGTGFHINPIPPEESVQALKTI